VRDASAVLAVALVGVVVTSCGTSRAAVPTTLPTSTVAPTSTTSTTTTTTSPPPPTTTTVAVPGSPQPSAEGAATSLVSAWATGNNARALTVATPDAVATLFAVPYRSGFAIDRGCTSAFLPLICTFGPPGGGPVNAAIYQLSVSQAPGGWYVSSVRIES